MRLRRWAARLVGALALVLAGLAVGTGPVAAAGPAAASMGAVPRPACQVGSDRIAVLVDFPWGRFTACVAAGSDDVDGIEVLRRAGLDPVTSGFGSVGGGLPAVCALRDPRNGQVHGCAEGPDCLRCLAPDYWGYFPGYRFSPVGGGSTNPVPSRVEAWRWGRSKAWPGSRPSAATLCPGPATTTTTTTTTRPPASTTPHGGATTAPPSTRPGSGSGGGSGDGSGDPSTTTRPGERPSTIAPPTTNRPNTTTTPGADPDDPADPADRSASGVSGPGDGSEEVAGGDPGGTVSVTDDGGGGAGALVPVATTAGVVAVVGAFALRARRRRPTAE